MSKSVVAIPARKPRNPFAVIAHQRRGGAHGVSASSRRHAARRALVRELIDLHPPST